LEEEWQALQELVTRSDVFNHEEYNWARGLVSLVL
jgi:hypothetical protein